MRRRSGSGARPPAPARPPPVCQTCTARDGSSDGCEGKRRLNRTAARSDTGRVRDGNEDRFLVREERGVLLIAVADGVGGAPGGEIAAEVAVTACGEHFFHGLPERTIEERLVDAMREANAAVLRVAQSSGKTGAASTLVVAAIRKDRVVIGNLGDSRAYLVRDGAPRQLTEDHIGAEARGITRFVGDPRGVQPDVFLDDLRADDRLVLCSDGLTRHVEATEIAMASTAHREDVGAAADALVALANSRGGEDNVTVVLHAARQRSRVSQSTRHVLALGALVALVAAGAIAVLLALALPGG